MHAPFSRCLLEADSNADDVGPSWAIVRASIILSQVLLALVAARVVGMRSQAAGHPFMPTGVVPTAAPKPSVRLVATYGLSALGVLLVCLQIIHAERHAGSRGSVGARALPVALMLGVRAVTVPPPPPLAFGAPGRRPHLLALGEPRGDSPRRRRPRSLYAMVRATEAVAALRAAPMGVRSPVRHGAGGGASSHRSSFSM